MKEEKRIIWKGFLINMLGVILAIVLTFGVNALWEKREENKKVKEMLILVRNELKDCKEWFKDQEKVIKQDAYVFQKILDAKDNLTSIPMDTLEAYHSQVLGIYITPLTTSAWQIFHNSEMIQKLSDKELVIRLTDCYVMINILYEFILNDFWETKKKTNALFEFDTYRFFEAVMNNNEMVFFYAKYNPNQVGIWKLFLNVDAIIDYTILLLDKHGNYKYDMDEKDKELGSFINARMDSVFQKKDTIKYNE